MATIAQTKQPVARAEPTEKSSAIWAWATVGVLFLILDAWVFGNWARDLITGTGPAHRIYPGVTPVPQWMDNVQLGNSILSGGIIIWIFYAFVFKPLAKTGKMTFDAIFILAFIPMMWQDILPNYMNLVNGYNTNQFNLGSWSCYIPGWQSPGGCNLAEPPIWDFSFYILSGVAVIWSSMWLQSRKSTTNRSIGSLFLQYCIAVAFIDITVELIWVTIGVYHFAGAPKAISLFADTRWRFPLSEPLFILVTYGTWTALYYFRNDKGETLAERGLDQVNVSQGGKQWLRFLALSGAIDLIFLVAYSIPCILVYTQADEWPASVQDKSYMTAGICGEGTAYACNGKNLPIPRRDAISIGPNGELIVPPGVALPKMVQLKRTAD